MSTWTNTVDKSWRRTMSRLELLKEIKTELIDLEKPIAAIQNLEDAKRCKDNLVKLWENYGNILDIERG